jgi:hypothetical protein
MKESAMDQGYLVCPNCYKRIELTEAASQQIEERIRKCVAQDALHAAASSALELDELHAKVTERTKELDFERDFNARLKQDKVELERELAEARAEVFALHKRQLAVDARERELPLQLAHALDEERKKILNEAVAKAEESLSNGFSDLRGLQSQVARALEEERRQFWEDTKAQANDAMVGQVEDLKQQLAQRVGEVQHARDQEFTLRKRQRELDEREKDMQTVIRRSIDQERRKLWDAAMAKAEESLVFEINGLRDLQQELVRALEVERKRSWESAMARAQRDLQLQVVRTLDEERNKLWECALARAQDAHPMRDPDRDKQLAGMLRKIESLIERATKNGEASLMADLECRVEGGAMQELSSS